VTLFNGFANVSALRQARLSEDASVSDLARARQTVVFTVASNFLSLVTLQEQQVVQERNLAAQQALEAQIQILVTAGKRSIADLYQQQATVASSQSAVVTARRSVELAKVDVIQTLQLDAGKSYEFVAPTIDTTATAPRFVLDDLLTRAFADRADLKADATRVDVANEVRKSSMATRWPTVGLSVGYNSAYSSLSQPSVFTQFDQRRGGSVGLSLSIPIFDRGTARIAAQQAALQADNAKLAQSRTRQTVALDVRRAFLDYQSAVDQISATTAQQRAADLALSATQQRYNVGAATLVELTQAQAAQLAAAVALVNARYNLVFQQSLMSYYTGDLNPENVSFGR
jgi:outer membrane protein